MSATIVVFVDATRTHAVRVGDRAEHTVAHAGVRAADIAQTASAVADEVRTRLGAGATVLVFGLGLLEVAMPDLPPLEPQVAQALLRRDADRYFPFEQPVAAAVSGHFAFAAHAGDVAAWSDAFARMGPVVATTTIVDCLARAHSAGDAWYAVDAADGEGGFVHVMGGHVRDVRRFAADEMADRASQVPAARDVDHATLIDAASATRWAPVHTMLVDERLARRFASARRARWMRSAGAFAAALALLVVALDRRREGELAATEGAIAALVAGSAEPRAAEARLARASRELELLGAGGERAELAAVIARLGEVLPADAFVDRLEWDGGVWRIDGSAANAPRLVPLLDADPTFADVRIAAASARFLDQGRQRESFSITFRSRGGVPVRGASAAASPGDGGGTGGAP